MNSKQPFICLDAVLLWSIMADSHPQQTMRMGSLKHHKLSRPSSKHQNSIPFSLEPIPRAQTNLCHQSLLIDKDGDLLLSILLPPPSHFFHWKWITHNTILELPAFFHSNIWKKSGLSPWYSWFVNEVQSNFIISN